MKHPTPKEEKKLIDLLDEFSFLFSVNCYDRDICYKKENKKDWAASICIDTPYQRVTISIYPSFWTHTRDEQRLFILHEFCHIIPDPLQTIAEGLRNGDLTTPQQITDADEQATSRISLLLDAQFKGRHMYARKAYKRYL